MHQALPHRLQVRALALGSTTSLGLFHNSNNITQIRIHNQEEASQLNRTITNHHKKGDTTRETSSLNGLGALRLPHSSFNNSRHRSLRSTTKKFNLTPNKCPLVRYLTEGRMFEGRPC